MDNLQMIIIVGWIVIVIVLAVVMRIVSEKRRKKMSGMRIESVKMQLERIRKTYIKEESVKLAYVTSNNSMCQTAQEKAREGAKNVAKAVVRTALTGKASYRGSEIGTRDYVIGYGQETYYFFYVHSSNTAKEMNLDEERFFTFQRKDIERITIKEKRVTMISIDLKDGTRVGFKLKDRILGEVDYTTENEEFRTYIKKQSEQVNR